MSKLAAIQALAAEAAAVGPNMTEVQKGGTARLLPEGYAFARFVEYVELGKQPQEFNGKAKDPKLEARIGFALYDTGDRKYSNDDGTPYIVRPYSFSIDRNEKARAFLLFKAMNWRNLHTHFGQMLGEAFLVQIVSEEKSKTDKSLVSRINLKTILPPLDAASQMPYNIPPAREEDLNAFFWDKPTLEAWNALYIEGQYEAKDGKPAQSKNFTQETIAGAVDFPGSALEALLLGGGAVVPHTAVPATPALPAAPAAAVAPSAPAVGVPGVPFVPASVAPVVPQGIPAPASVGAPALPVIPTMTSPSSLPAMPSLPSIPALPSLPV